MKKITTLLFPLLLLASCSGGETLKVKSYHYAYQTSEVQEYTHDIYLAKCENDAFIEIPTNTKPDKVSVKKTDLVIYYYVYGVEEKVSNKGYVII